jgi:competence protein ComEC
LGIIFCLAYLVGVGVAGFSGWVGAALAFALGVVAALVAPFLNPAGPKRWVWLLAALLSTLACAYAQVRVPQPAENDVSTFVQGQRTTLTVRGRLAQPPTTTRSDRARFILNVEQVNPAGRDDGTVSDAFRPASGQLYVTLPLLQATGLGPGQRVDVTGLLYRPSGAENPGQFDFQRFLARQGIFAGMAARRVVPQEEGSAWGSWRIGQRVVQAHVLGAGMPEGALLSAIILGNRAVDVPNDVKDTFVQAGLAAALAASGFQVTLVLGAVLALVGDRYSRWQFGVGLTSLLGFITLTGISPSVLRAGIMGAGSLVGRLLQRRSRPLVFLLVAAVVLLLWQPLWFYDLGFQFSFLATFGLMTTAQGLEKRLDWLPPLVAAALAVPIAATIWTLPVQLFAFGRIAPYSILANVLTLPLISLATFGGILSGFLGLLWLPLGGAIAWLLYPVVHATIAIAQFINQLPGATTYTGTIALWQVLATYSAMLLVWLLPPVGRRWPIAALLAGGVLFLPGTLDRATQFQATVLAVPRAPIMVIQSGGETFLINSGNAQTASNTVVPLLQRSGINQIDWAIATSPQLDASEGWKVLLQNRLPIKAFAEVPGAAPQTYKELQQILLGAGIRPQTLGPAPIPLSAGRAGIELLSTSPFALRLQLQETTWLILDRSDRLSQTKLLEAVGARLKSQILWIAAERPEFLEEDFLRAIAPETAIVTGTNLPSGFAKSLEDRNIRLLHTQRDGAIFWSAQGTLQSLRDREDSQSFL